MSARALISGLAPQQLFFSFVSDDERTKLDALYETHFDKAGRNAVRRAEANRQKLALKVHDGKTLPFSSPGFLQVLDRPIGLYQASDLDVQPASDPDSDVEDALQRLRVVVAEERDVEHWSDDAIGQLHEGVLHYSLAMLKSKGNAEEKQDTLRWIWAPSVFCWVSRRYAGTHRSTPIYRRDLPFTFERCCAVTGMRPDELRAGIAYILRKFAREVGIQFEALGIDFDR